MYVIFRKGMFNLIHERNNFASTEKRSQMPLTHREQACATWLMISCPNFLSKTVSVSSREERKAVSLKKLHADLDDPLSLFPFLKSYAIHNNVSISSFWRKKTSLKEGLSYRKENLVLFQPYPQFIKLPWSFHLFS